MRVMQNWSELRKGLAILLKLICRSPAYVRHSFNSMWSSKLLVAHPDSDSKLCTNCARRSDYQLDAFSTVEKAPLNK